MTTKGFTMIELMIAVTVVMILSAIAIPNFIGYNSRVYQAEMLALERSIERVIEQINMKRRRQLLPPNSQIFMTQQDTGQQVTITFVNGGLVGQEDSIAQLIDAKNFRYDPQTDSFIWQGPIGPEDDCRIQILPANNERSQRFSDGC